MNCCTSSPSPHSPSLAYGDADEGTPKASPSYAASPANGGHDTLSGGDGIDLLVGDAWDIVVNGGDDKLSGDKGNDALVGEELPGEAANGGDDFLNGGGGNDVRASRAGGSGAPGRGRNDGG
jgi:Ca2+-binding RTX toxin-like protein